MTPTQQNNVDGECYSSRAGVVCPLHKLNSSGLAKPKRVATVYYVCLLLCIYELNERVCLCLCVQYFTL